jgi:hypothetical protein
MTITTELCGVTKKGTNIGVRIKRERPERPEGIPEILDNIVGDLYETMEIVSILKALKDSNEKAFNIAMEHFIEEELSDGESVR